jgi:Asp/Glu/hydantoin racemase
MRLLLINPNTTEAMTAKAADACRAAFADAASHEADAAGSNPGGVEIVAATGRFGARYIASEASYAIAGHAALDCFAKHNVAEHGSAFDAVLLACFGDPGLEALREVSSVPVISLIDASCAQAGVTGRRFAIVTGGDRWGPMLTRMIAARGLGAQLTAIRTVAPTGGQIASDPQGALALLAKACRDCVETDGAEAVILGGTGLIGLAALIQADVPVPVICSNEAGFRAAWATLRQTHRDNIAGTDPVESIGLSPELAGLLVSGR